MSFDDKSKNGGEGTGATISSLTREEVEWLRPYIGLASEWASETLGSCEKLTQYGRELFVGVELALFQADGIVISRRESPCGTVVWRRLGSEQEVWFGKKRRLDDDDIESTRNFLLAMAKWMLNGALAYYCTYHMNSDTDSWGKVVNLAKYREIKAKKQGINPRDPK